MAPPNSPLIVSRPPRIPMMASIATDNTYMDHSSRKDMPSSTRSASHFLDGFNVDDIKDVRSIPDPPTPQPRKRRLSTPMNLRSFQDVTNNPESKPNTLKNVTNRRARKSLCHVPSPAVGVQESRTTAAPLIPPHLDESNQPSSASTPICLDDDDDNPNTGSSRRRKKRQSMVIPNELVVQPEKGEEGPASIPSKPSSFKGTLQDMKALQVFVRGYCSLPVEERDTSDQASKIQESTGYALHNNLFKDDVNSLDHAGRRLIYHKISPVIQDMEQRKLEDILMWEKETGCRVEKSRSGKYRYLALDTNKKIGSAKYMKRYMAVIHDNAPERLAKANVWKAKLQQVPEPNESGRAPAKSEDGCAKEEESSNAAFLESALVALDQQVQEEESAAPASRPQSSQGEGVSNTSMELCDLSVGLDMGDAANILEEKDVVSACSSEEAVPPEDETASSPQEAVGMPSRDQSSKDPDIARAEQTLWKRIDEALQEYSQEVLEIMRERKRQKTNHSDEK